MKAKPGCLGAFALLGLVWVMSGGVACAQGLVVVLSSPEDAASADKLAELIREPFERVDAASLQALPPTAAGGCHTRARVELHLDSAGRKVQLVRCRDATVLARGLDPEAASQTPYLGAFVAAELLAIDRELVAAEARAPQSALPAASSVAASAAGSGSASSPAGSGSASSPAGSGSASSPAASTRAASAAASGDAPAASSAAVSGGGRASAVSGRAAPLETSPVELQLRAGAELLLWGAPFDHGVRPNLGLALVLAPDPARLAWFAELSVGLFARGEEQRTGESLTLRRHDGALHAGVRLPFGPLNLAGFALARASLTSSEYTADLTASDSFVRMGVGVGAQADAPLGRVFSVYLRATFDVATSRSEYLVAGRSYLRDPPSLLWVGLGLLLRVRP